MKSLLKVGHFADSCSHHVFMDIVLFIPRLHCALCKERILHKSFLEFSRNEKNVGSTSGPSIFPRQSELHAFEQGRSLVWDSLIVSESGDERGLSR